ncbi:MAG: hypothetical protein ACKO85_14760, partial [Isosphaeraceae bacterium]
MKNRLNDHDPLANKFLVLSILSLIWFVPFFQILIEVLSPSNISPHQVSTGLIGLPPPWLNSNNYSSRWVELGWHSVRLGSVSALIAIPASLFIAFLFDQYNWPGKQLFEKFWRLFIFIPLPITATIWLGSFSNLGRAQAFGFSN